MYVSQLLLKEVFFYGRLIAQITVLSCDLELEMSINTCFAFVFFLPSLGS